MVKIFDFIPEIVIAVLYSFTEIGIYYRRSTLDFSSPLVIPSTLSTSYEQGCGFTNGDLGVTYGKNPRMAKQFLGTTEKMQNLNSIIPLMAEDTIS